LISGLSVVVRKSKRSFGQRKERMEEARWSVDD